VSRLEQLPAEAKLKNEIAQMASLLNRLRTAPLVDDLYQGVVLFEDEAVAEIVSQTFFSSSNGLITKRKQIRDKPSTGSQNENKYDALLGKTVIDKNLTIKAIDHTHSYDGVPLIGSYEIDAEGVSVKDKIVLIENGVLQTLLSDRIPTHSVAQSNGHKRLLTIKNGLQSRLAPGVIEMTAKQTTSTKKIKQQMINIAKKKGEEYVYVVRKINDNNAGSEVKPAIKPTYIYRISVKDGAERLVRTTTISNISVDSFKEILAVSDKRQAWNIRTALQGSSEGIYSSFVVPRGILLPDIEVRRNENVTLQKFSITPNPLQE
jgi:hypothetical protein